MRSSSATSGSSRNASMGRLASNSQATLRPRRGSSAGVVIVRTRVTVVSVIVRWGRRRRNAPLAAMPLLGVEDDRTVAGPQSGAARPVGDGNKPELLQHLLALRPQHIVDELLGQLRV